MEKVYKELKTNFWLAYKSLVSILKVLFYSQLFPNYLPQTNTQAVILDNGASLGENLEDKKEFLSFREIYVLNHFPLASIFKELKPQNYVIFDSDFFDFSPNNFLRKDIATVLEHLAAVDWEMKIYFPQKFKKSFFITTLVSNSNLQLFPINSVEIEGFSFWKYFLFEYNFAMPYHKIDNLLSTLFVAINRSHPQILLMGSDQSYHKEMRVDFENGNELKHPQFYPEEIQVSTLKFKSMANFFQIMNTKFKSFETLEEYAYRKNISVFNASKDSFIDVFKKVIL